MSLPVFESPQTMRSVNLKNDLIQAAQRAKDSTSQDQLEDALRSVDYFSSLLRKEQRIQIIASDPPWPINSDLICIAKDSAMGLYFNERYKLVENTLDSSLIIVNYNGEKRFQSRSSFKLA